MSAKRKICTTPIGIASYPWLNKADVRFDKEGSYHVKLRLPKADVAELIASLEETAAQALVDAKKDISEKAKNKKEEQEKLKKCVPADLPWKDVLDDDGNETGDVEINFKMKAIVKPKEGKPFTQKPKIFDSKGKEAPNIAVYGGSRIKVAYQIVPFFTPLVGAGVSLRLVAVQVIELVSGGGNAESYGFGEEDGYDYTPDDSKPFGESPDASVDCPPEGNSNDF